MRALALTVLVLAMLPGCIHLPDEVAAVVQHADPASSNHFSRRSAPDSGDAHGPATAP